MPPTEYMGVLQLQTKKFKMAALIFFEKVSLKYCEARASGPQLPTHVCVGDLITVYHTGAWHHEPASEVIDDVTLLCLLLDRHKAS